jgi:hypothetical protein
MHAGRVSGLNIEQTEFLIALHAKSGKAKLPSTEGMFPELFSKMKIRSVIKADDVLVDAQIVKEHILFYTNNAGVIFANSSGFNQKCAGIRLDSPASDRFYSAASSQDGALVSFQTSNVTMLCDTRVDGFNIVQLIFDTTGKKVGGHYIDDNHKWVILFGKDSPGIEIHRIEPVDFGTAERTFEHLLGQTVSTRVAYEEQGHSPGIIGVAAFSADSKHMVTAGSAMRHAKFLLWDMTPADGRFTFSPLPIRVNKPVTAISFSDDGKFIVFSTTTHIFTFSVAELTNKRDEDKENKFGEPLMKTEIASERAVIFDQGRRYCAFLESNASPLMLDHFNINVDQLSIVKLSAGGTPQKKHKNVLRHPMALVALGRASRFVDKYFLCDGLVFGREYITVYDCESGLTLMHAKPNFAVQLCSFRALLWENNALVQVTGFNRASLPQDSKIGEEIERGAYINEEHPAAQTLATEQLLMLELLYLKYQEDKDDFAKKNEKEIAMIPEEYHGMFTENKYIHPDPK